MVEFNKFKQAVCNFYRKNKELTYLAYVDCDWAKSFVVVEFKTDNVKIVYSYKLSSNEYMRITQLNKKAERLMREISKDLQGIENEQN